MSVVANGDGTYTLTYTLTVTRGGSAGTYDLDDELLYGSSVTVQSTSVDNTTPGGLPVNAGWNGVGSTDIATDVPIAAGATHVYTVTVVASVDPATVTFANSDCPVGPGETGSGFANRASLSVGGNTVTDEACEEFPAVVVDKQVTGTPTPLGANQYEVVYEVTATNTGAGAGVYDLAGRARPRCRRVGDSRPASPRRLLA